MQLNRLTTEGKAEHKATHVAILTHADLTEATADTAQAIALIDVENKMAVECVKAVLITDFEDASDAAFNSTALEVGDGDDVDELLVSQELNVNGTEVDLKRGTAVIHTYTAADTVDAVFEAMAAKSLSNIDAGEVHVYLNVDDHR